MLAKVRELTRYKVIVLSLRDKRSKNFQDDFITVNDRDTFFGYAYPRHIVGKFIDLWFNNPKEKDPENFVTFGRITSITPAYFGPGLIYGTKLGRFYVEEMKDGEEEGKKAQHQQGVGKGQGTRGSAGGHRADPATVSRAWGGRRIQTDGFSTGGGRSIFPTGSGAPTHQHRSEAVSEAQHLQGNRTGGGQLKGLAASSNVPKK